MHLTDLFFFLKAPTALGCGSGASEAACQVLGQAPHGPGAWTMDPWAASLGGELDIVPRAGASVACRPRPRRGYRLGSVYAQYMP